MGSQMVGATRDPAILLRGGISLTVAACSPTSWPVLILSAMLAVVLSVISAIFMQLELRLFSAPFLANTLSTAVPTTRSHVIYALDPVVLTTRPRACVGPRLAFSCHVVPIRFLPCWPWIHLRSHRAWPLLAAHSTLRYFLGVQPRLDVRGAVAGVTRLHPHTSAPAHMCKAPKTRHYLSCSA